MKTEKVVNYTQEQVKTIVEGYTAGATAETLAAQVGKSVRSVVAKLSREGVYVAKARSTTNKAKGTKADLIAKIAKDNDVDVKVLASLEKATKEALEVLAS